MRIALALVVSVVVVARVGVAAQTRTFKEQINVSPGQTLDLRLEIGGSVRIFRSDEASVSVEAIFSGGDTADIASPTTIWRRPTRNGRHREQIGNAPGREPVEFIVIEHVERPTEN